MKLLNTHSLIVTLENYETARFMGEVLTSEYGGLVEWVSTRLGLPGGYGGSFAMTEEDWQYPFRLWTGEKLSSRAGRSHVIAQGVMKMLCEIENETGERIDSLHKSEERLSEQIFTGEDRSREKSGIYCCATCSVSLWRAMNRGSYSEHRGFLKRGMEELKEHREGKVGWRRFPFYYTMLFLSEADEELYSTFGEREAIIHRSEMLGKMKDPYAQRRNRILDKILQDKSINQKAGSPACTG